MIVSGHAVQYMTAPLRCIARSYLAREGYLGERSPYRPRDRISEPSHRFKKPLSCLLIANVRGKEVSKQLTRGVPRFLLESQEGLFLRVIATKVSLGTQTAWIHGEGRIQPESVVTKYNTASSRGKQCMS